MERMEAELNVLRTAAASGFGGGLRQQRHQHQHQHQHRHTEMSASSKDSPSQQLASPAPSGGGPSCDTCVLGKDCACLSAAVGDTSPPQQQSITIPQSPEQDLETTSKDDACGLCSSGSCLCQDLGLRDSAPKTSSSPSPPSTPPQSTKRKRSKPSASSLLLPTPTAYPMEIDFTTSFTSTFSPPSSSRRDELPNGGCGFCSDGTPCVCLQNTLPPLQTDLTALVPEAHPEAIRRGGGRRPQMTDVNVVGNSVPRVGSPATIASGNGGCTGEPGIPLLILIPPRHFQTAVPVVYYPPAAYRVPY